MEEDDVGGSTAPDEVLPPEQTDADAYEVVTETTEVQSLLNGDGIRFLFTSFVRTSWASRPWPSSSSR